ncbi:MAG TPA: heterodisulfide reductase-related iron-sulfur binding cluster, partial [Ramlibacter sp.]|nr:heterodisulfide reductase-related iron-sulfur binding cluster [Ramlibacter sp.]
AQMRRNVDAWWPLVERGEVEALVMNASGCGVTVREYGHHLRHEPAYADKARRISELTCDLSELLPDLVPALQERVRPPQDVFAYHPPCTLQHGQKLRGGVEEGLQRLGFQVRPPLNEAHLCCGSAGTYSVLHPEIARKLRDRKLEHLGALAPVAVLSANIGCISHLQSGTPLPVRHWVEVLDEALTP